jgi:hypothetical protein
MLSALTPASTTRTQPDFFTGLVRQLTLMALLPRAT